MTTAGLGAMVAQRTMALAVKHTAFGNTRQADTEHVNIDKTEAGGETDKGMVTVMKDLIDSPELEAITKFDSETGGILRHLGHASRLQHRGMYTIATGMVPKLQAIMKERELQRSELVSKAVEMYPQRVAEASAKLGVIHDPNDYITQTQFADKFSFTWQWIKVVVPTTLRDIDPALYEAEDAKQEALNQKLAEEMRLAAREAVANMVKWLRTSLEPTEDGKRRRFYANSVLGLQEQLDLFKMRDTTEDNELARLVEQAKGIIGDANPDDFRDKSPAGDAYRERIREEMAKLEGALEPLVETVRTRKILIERNTVAA
jgi:hypothetical protein